MSPPPQTTRYLMVKRPDHPLATPSRGLVYVHRAVLYDAIGPGVHLCHWCAREVEWDGTKIRRLVVDHVDGDTRNNALANLVPACYPCNTLRGKRANFLTHCHAGHEWTAESTYIRPDTGQRQCRSCRKERSARELTGYLLGSANPSSKLTEADVREIRRRRADGESPGLLAIEYQIERHAIQDIMARRTWAHVR